MTMDFELLVDDDEVDPQQIAEVIEHLGHELRSIEATFSTFRADSWVSRLNRGEVTLDQCPSEVADVFGRCAAFTTATGGAFNPVGPTGGYDPTGIVKTWAMERVRPRIETLQARRWLWGCSGDATIGGTAPRSWTVGVADPRTARAENRMIDRVTLSPANPAIATSGISEHGAHIWGPDSRAASPTLSATVIGTDLVSCDAWATAIVAGGQPTAQRAAAAGLEFTMIHERNGQLVAQRSPGWPRT